MSRKWGSEFVEVGLPPTTPTWLTWGVFQSLLGGVVLVGFCGGCQEFRVSGCVRGNGWKSPGNGAVHSTAREVHIIVYIALCGAQKW